VHARGARVSRMVTHPVAAARVRSADRVAKMRAAPAPPRMVGRALRAAQARRNVVVLARRAALAQLNPRMPRLRVAARHSPPSGPRRPPARHRPRLRAPLRGHPQSARSLPPRRPNAPPARPPRSAKGTAIVRLVSVRDSNRLRPKRRLRRLLRLRQLSRQRRQPQPSSGPPLGRLARRMLNAPPGQVTPSDRTVSVPVTSAPARMRPPRPPLRRRPHRPLPQLLRLHPLPPHLRRQLRQRGPSRLQPLPRLRRPQREPSRRHQPRLHRPRLRPSRQRLPQPSRWMLPASASRICAANAGNVVKAAG
jgi:hypothetical protein